MGRGRGRAGSGGLCRSESGGGDSFAGAGGEAGFLTHCGTGGAGAGPGWGLGLPRAPAICSGGKGRRRGIPWVRGPPVGSPNSLCSFPREPSGRRIVTARSLFVYFHICPQETPLGQSFLIHPLMGSGALALGTVPSTSSRLGGSVNSSGRKGEGAGRRETGQERTETEADSSLHFCKSAKHLPVCYRG